MLEPGQKIFEFEIIRPLGRGGFAAVFEAKDRLLGRRVAIKQLLLDRAKDEKNLKRFVQEARVIAKLSHPNIVTIHALRLEGNNFLMVMEYLPDGSLRELLNRRGKLPVEQAVQLAIGICEGLAQFHENGIIHRDIKGENILLDADGRPKVIDFGIAHVPEEMGGFDLTQAGFQPSTLLYSSPEQVLGHNLDARSDVYQIGEMLYYMLMGRHYIDLGDLEVQALTSAGSNQIRSQAKLFELMEVAICEKMPEGLKVLWREVGALAEIVEMAMAKSREDRFKDAGEFAAALRSLSINTTPVSAGVDNLSFLDARAYNRRGLAHTSTRNYEQAIIDFNKALQLDADYAEAYINRSAAHLLMRNYGQAVADATSAIEDAPDFVAAYVNRGIAYTGLRRYEDAQTDYLKAMELDPNNVYAHYNLANTYIWMGKFQEAIDYFTKTITLDPEFVAAYTNRGVVYTELKDYPAALADFSSAIELNPDYVHAYYNRANAYREFQQPDQAVIDYGKVIQLNPEHEFVYDNRGDAFATMGKEDEAAEDYARIVRNISTIHPKRLTVAASMIMPATPLDFLKRE